MKLTMKGAPFFWADDCEASSCTLKKKLVSAPILKLPESGKCFIVYTDASRVGLGYVFIKEGWVISYEHEEKYPTHDIGPICFRL